MIDSRIKWVSDGRVPGLTLCRCLGQSRRRQCVSVQLAAEHRTRWYQGRRSCWSRMTGCYPMTHPIKKKSKQKHVKITGRTFITQMGTSLTTFYPHFHLTNPFDLNVETHMFGNSVEYLGIKGDKERHFGFITNTVRKDSCFWATEGKKSPVEVRGRAGARRSRHRCHTRLRRK